MNQGWRCCSVHLLIPSLDLVQTELKSEADEIWQEYFENQRHGSLKDYLVHCLRTREETESSGSLIQVKTTSVFLIILLKSPKSHPAQIFLDEVLHYTMYS